MKCEMLRFSSLALAAIVLSSCGAGGASRDNIDQSIRQFQLAASLREEGRTPGAIQHLRQAIELDPDNAEAHLLLGFIQMERRAFSNAEGHLKNGVQRLVNLDRKGATLAEARNMHGLCLIELERYDEAIEVLSQSANDELNTAPHLAWGNLGLAYFRTGQWRSSVEATSEATRMQPRFCVGYYTMGRALFEMGKFEQAEEALVRAIEVDKECQVSPLLQGAWRLRGEVRARLGHRRDAVADLERCVELGPTTDHGSMCQKILQSDR